MTVKITKPALNLREELASLRNQGSAYEESKFYLDNLVTNGTFDSDTSGWTVGSNTSVSHSSGNLVIQGNGYVYQWVPTVVGKTYVVEIEVSAVSSSPAGSWELRVGTDYYPPNLHDGVTHFAAGTVSATFTAITTTSVIVLKTHGTTGGTQTVSWDNVSVHEVAPNLVTNGTFDSDLTGWTDNSSGTGSAVYDAGTVKLTSADSGSNVGRVEQLSIATPSMVTISYEVTAITGGQVYVYLDAAVQAQAWTTGTYSVTFSADGTSTLFFRLIGAGTVNIDNVIVTQGNHHAIHSTPYGYEIKDVYIDGDLAREGEAYDYTVHDGYIKPTIEPTATTETCVIGVRK